MTGEGKKDLRTRLSEIFCTDVRSWLLLPGCLLLCLALYFCAAWLGGRGFRAALAEIEDAEPQTRENAPLYNALSAREQMLYDVMAEAAADEAKETAVLAFVPTEDEFLRARDAVVREHPENYLVSSDGMTLHTSEHTAAVRMEYRENAADCRGRMEAWIAEILAEDKRRNPSSDTYETMLYLHDALAARAVCAGAGTAQAGRTAYDALAGIPSDGLAYALAYSLLCERAGISCRTVAGNAGGAPHIWNYVSADGETGGHTDVFWDDSARADVLLPFHGYFYLSGETASADHTVNAEEAETLPALAAAEDYYVRAGRYSEPEELPALLSGLVSDAVKTGTETVEFCLSGDIGEEALHAAFADAVAAAAGAEEAEEYARRCTDFRITAASGTRPAYTVRLYYEENDGT